MLEYTNTFQELHTSPESPAHIQLPPLSAFLLLLRSQAEPTHLQYKVKRGNQFTAMAYIQMPWFSQHSVITIQKSVNKLPLFSLHINCLCSFCCSIHEFSVIPPLA